MGEKFLAASCLLMLLISLFGQFHQVRSELHLRPPTAIECRTAPVPPVPPVPMEDVN